MKCNLCGSDSNKIIYNYTRFEKNHILECNNCGLVFLELTRSKEEVEKSYVKEYRNRPDSIICIPEQLFNDPVVQQDCSKRLSWLLQICGSLKDKRIVEIGSASGAFLSTLREAGAKVIGIELNYEQVTYCRQKGLVALSTP